MQENKKIKKIVSFPHMGNYFVPAKYLLTHVLHCKVMVAPRITSHTIELGNKYSPAFVCTPFKYTLGTLMESLENGANVLIQAGGGCKYGYYSELQIELLRETGYVFEFVNLVSQGKTRLMQIYHFVKQIDPKFQVMKAIKYFLITKKMIAYMDSIDHIIRNRVGFEVEENSFITLQHQMLHKFAKVKSQKELKQCYLSYKKQFLELPIDMPSNPIKVGVIGELYTLMEPFSNYYLEKTLAKNHVAITRFTNVQYLVFEKKKKMKKLLKYASHYIQYKMGADASDNIAWTKYLCEEKYDGIIHVKSAFCTPEIGAMAIIQRICSHYHMPVLFFTFDEATTEVGIETRLEAFYDVIKERHDL